MRGFPVSAARPEDHAVMIGWDSILQTFFFEVHCREALKANRALDRAIKDCDPDGPEFDRLNRIPEEETIRVSRGTTHGEIKDVDTLRRLVWPYLATPLGPPGIFRTVRDYADGVLFGKG